MFNKIRKLFMPKSLKEGSRIVVNSEKIETRVALLKEGKLEEYTVERAGDEHVIGSIYKGVVKNIEVGLNALFVDVGLEKNVFLHFWDAIPEVIDSGVEKIQKKNKGSLIDKKKKRIHPKDIPDLYPVGSEVVVQITKAPIGNKGARGTTNISLAGRYLVIMPRNDQFGISRKIDNGKERDRLRKILSEKLSIPDKMGVIFRSMAEGHRVRYFVRDLSILLDRWSIIEERSSSLKAPSCLFNEPDLVERTIRDFLTDEISEVICDDLDVADKMKGVVEKISKRSKNKVKYFDTQIPIFEKFGIQSQIDDVFHRQVWLPSGGYIVIDETEALIAIDVNTGRSKSQDKMILQTNLEASEEIARQLRLRNIGGIIVVDFIDMRYKKDQITLYKSMKDHLLKDKAKVQVLQISQFGLMEMTRQRLHESLDTTIKESCYHCQGRGTVKNTESMSLDIQRILNRVLSKRDVDKRELTIIIHPAVMNRLRKYDSDMFVGLERNYNAKLIFKNDISYFREKITVLDTKTNKEIEI